MLTVADNQMLTRCGPGTPMGNLMRLYWIPTVKSDELPGPDCPPVRIRVLNESLIAFRNTSGKVGLVADYCPHRGASMFFGRNEDDGLTCVYHGWKFDITGQCTEMLNELEESNFKNKVKIKAYPCVERGGVVWSYMGPREVPPPLPDVEGNMKPGATVRVSMNYYNYFVALENNFDTAHAPILHYGSVTPENDPGDHGIDNTIMTANRSSKFEVVDTEAGVTYGNYRPTPTGEAYWRTHNFLFPFFDQSPRPKLGASNNMRANVPVDDYHSMEWSFTSPFEGQEDDYQFSGPNYRQVYPTIPNSTDWLGRFRNPNIQGVAEDFGLDREIQKASPPECAGWTGLPTVSIQDEVMRWCAGRADDNGIVDRSKEHLGSTDAPLIRMRRRMLDAAKALQEHGTLPPGVDHPEYYRMRGGWAIIPDGANWFEATRSRRYAFREETQVVATTIEAR